MSKRIREISCPDAISKRVHELSIYPVAMLSRDVLPKCPVAIPKRIHEMFCTDAMFKRIIEDETEQMALLIERNPRASIAVTVSRPAEPNGTCYYSTL